MKQSLKHRAILRADVEKRRVQCAARKAAECQDFLNRLGTEAANDGNGTVYEFYSNLADSVGGAKESLIRRIVELTEKRL